MIDRGRHPILGVQVNAMDAEAAVDAIIRAGTETRPLTVSCSAVHSVMEGALDAEHRQRLNALDLVLPDGQPVRWALQWRHGVSLPNRVYGPDLMLALCARAEAEQVPIFLYGSTQQTLERLSAALLRRYPNLVVAGTRPSAFRRVSEQEQRQIAAEIRDSGARLVFVGLGCPRQEIWAYENAGLISIPVVAVGAAFDFHAGAQAQAPAWMQRAGLEWLFRLSREPRRLWRRYLILNPLYLLLLAGELIGVKRSGRNDVAPQRIRVA